MSGLIYVALLVCFAIGVPIAFALGLSCVVAISIDPSMPMVWIAQRMFAGINSFPYLALPFFILAGNIMAEGGISRRLVKFCSTLVGRYRGGLAIVAVLVSLFFGAICGSAAACCAAVGAILIPGMLEKKYSREFSAATISSASCLGVMIPPSVPMVLYQRRFHGWHRSWNSLWPGFYYHRRYCQQEKQFWRRSGLQRQRNMVRI